MGIWVEDEWRWNLSWRRVFFEWEMSILDEFVNLIHQFVPADYDDKWLWKENSEEGFSVKVCYNLLYRGLREQVLLNPCAVCAFSNLWKCGAPSKVCVFSWKLLLDRIPTKVNLWKRGVIEFQHINCVLCGSVLESSVHLLLHCDISAKVWYEIMRWLGFVIIVPMNLISSFGMLVGYGRCKREKKCLALIWNSFMWSIWRCRNDCVFNNKAVVIAELVDQIKFQAWKWFIGRAAKNPCLLYEWLWSPFDCF
jgi:hypothetical protein